ncbi:MAG: FadR family transcriptional regulator [Deltaproteobacteria bacterium]|nr:FadR family transcriptional regulator [Deltaproteobacteria bacterium]
MFQTVRQNKAPQQIIHQIRSSILEGQLKPGDKLASESELMTEFAVSKSTLREALRALEYLGLIEIRKGANGGAFVAEVDMEITKESLANFLHFKNLSVQHISAIRKNLEPYAARVAAETISPEDLDRLKDLLEVCRNALSKGDSTSLRKNEVQFHRIIANATHNPILILILDFIENLLEDVKRILKPDMAFSKRVIESHERIYGALKKRDPERASREMLVDVLNVEKGLARLSKKKK